MKRFLFRNMYYFILLGSVIVCIAIGFLFGRLSANAAKPSADETEPSIVAVSPEPPEWTSLGEFKLTGYCTCSECCDGYADGYTATMTTATPGRTIAVDPTVIPYGTEVKINGDIFIAEDCGEAIKGNRIDMLCANHELAEKFGVQYADVYIKNQAHN